MKKILFSLIILLFSSVIANTAEKQKCRELKIGKAYFECLKGKLSGATGNSSESDKSKDTRNWYQKIKDGKPLLSK